MQLFSNRIRFCSRGLCFHVLQESSRGRVGRILRGGLGGEEGGARGEVDRILYGGKVSALTSQA